MARRFNSQQEGDAEAVPTEQEQHQGEEAEDDYHREHLPLDRQVLHKGADEFTDLHPHCTHGFQQSLHHSHCKGLPNQSPTQCSSRWYLSAQEVS